MTPGIVRRRVANLLAMSACLLSIAVVPLAAQGGPPGGGSRGGKRDGMPDPQHMQMERRLQERINEVVRQRLALSDEQFNRLREVASKVEDDRRVLRNEEMTMRFGLRQELLAGDKADESKVARFLEQMPRFERRRLDLMEREQEELAKFLTPSQRARYIGLQDELRRGMLEVQRRRMGADSGRGPGRSGMRRPPPPPANR